MQSSLNIVAVGLNHRTAHVGIREKFAIPHKEIASALQSLTRTGLLREAVILSTCNRVEIYTVCSRIEEAVQSVFDFLKQRSGLDPRRCKEFYTHAFPSSVQHLYEVCSGLDSMVVGETEILGQAKDFYRLAHEAQRAGPALHKLFQSAFSVAKAIRSRTRIGMGSVSVGSVAVDLACQIFGNLKCRNVMLVGAGKMSETTARSLRRRGAGALIVTNRSHDRAVALAHALGGTSVPWDVWHEECERADIVISSTAAPYHVVTREKLEPVIRRRNGTPLFLIDIAVPRDIERSVSQLEGVYLYDIDDLQVIADQNLAMRHKEIALCRQIVREHVDQFGTWFLARAAQIEKAHVAWKMEKWSPEKESGLAACQ